MAKGNRATEKQCVEAWEAIVKKNAEVTGSYDFDAYFTTEEGLAIVLHEYNEVKVRLALLHCKEDDESVMWLKARGYRFHYKNSKEYAEQLAVAVWQSEKLWTRIQVKQNELSEFGKDSEEVDNVSLEVLLGSLSINLPFEVSDEVTLARFNTYKKFVEEKNKHGRDKQEGFHT